MNGIKKMAYGSAWQMKKMRHKKTPPGGGVKKVKEYDNLPFF